MEINTYSEWLGFGLVAILLVVLFVCWVLVKERGIVARDKAAEIASETSGLDAEAMTPDAPAEPGDGDLGATTDLPTGIVGGGLSWYGKNEGVMSETYGVWWFPSDPSGPEPKPKRHSLFRTSVREVLPWTRRG